MTENTWDAVVIGAGAGGLFAAARLSHLGYKTLVVERLDKVGGRASTDDVDDFKVNNGAIVIELGGITEETFDEVGAKFDIRRPEPPILYRIGGKDIDVTGGGWGFLMSTLTRQGAKLVKGIGAARHDSGLPEDELSTADWVAKYTKNESVHGIFRNMCGVGIRGRFRGVAGSGVPHLLHSQERVQEFRLLSGGHYRGVEVARGGGREQRWGGVARQ